MISADGIWRYTGTQAHLSPASIAIAKFRDQKDGKRTDH